MSKWRNYLGKNIGNIATITSSDFAFLKNASGDPLLLLRTYDIKLINYNNTSIPKPKNLPHIWIKIPEHLQKQCQVIEKEASQIVVKGVIYKYKYRNQNEHNVTIEPESINTLKVKKAIRKERREQKKKLISAPKRNAYWIPDKKKYYRCSSCKMLSKTELPSNEEICWNCGSIMSLRFEPIAFALEDALRNV